MENPALGEEGKDGMIMREFEHNSLEWVPTPQCTHAERGSIEGIALENLFGYLRASTSILRGVLVSR